jgi:glycosyltransferase involved in cell wall biosynthesis
MRVSFIFPSSHYFSGGTTMFFEFANVLARRGHEVHFLHAPAWPHRVDRVQDIPFHFDPRVDHHIADSLDDPSLPEADVQFGHGPSRLGHKAVIVQGFRLTGAEWDAQAYRALAPKICVATWLVDVGRWYGVDEQQLMHVPMGLDHDLFGVRTPLTDRPIDVAMLYNPMPEKGWTTGLAALEELARRRPGFRAVVFTLGDTPNDALPAGVEIVTGLEQARLAREVYDRTKVMVQSSRHEGFGLTAIEAMACGAALVTTDCGGSRDYAVPGVTAAVVARDDPAALADATDAVLGDDEHRLELARAGARFVRRFDWQRSGERLEGFLEAYIADPPRYQRPPGEDRSAQYSLDRDPAR